MDELFRSTADSSWHNENLINELKNINIPEGDYFPIDNNIFRVFRKPLSEVKVVILGQDPYHGFTKNNDPQATGLAFGVPYGAGAQPSLKNIAKVCKVEPSDDWITLEHWERQGVFLLNTALTVECHKPNSHAKHWERFTEMVIDYMSKNNDKLIFLLWGNNAKEKRKFIDVDKHYVLQSTHPSPFSFHRGFNTCDHFNKTNNYLEEKIMW